MATELQPESIADPLPEELLTGDDSSFNKKWYKCFRYDLQHVETAFLQYALRDRLGMLAVLCVTSLVFSVALIFEENPFPPLYFFVGSNIVSIVVLAAIHIACEQTALRKKATWIAVFEYATLIVALLQGLMFMVIPRTWTESSIIAVFAEPAAIMTLYSLVFTMRVDFRISAVVWTGCWYLVGRDFFRPVGSQITAQIITIWIMAVACILLVFSLFREAKERERFETYVNLEQIRYEVSGIHHRQAEALNSVVPISVAKQLVSGQPVVDAKSFACVICTTVCHFQKWCADKCSHDIISLLDEFYSVLDLCAAKGNAMKITTWLGVHICCLGLRGGSCNSASMQEVANALHAAATEVASRFGLKVRVAASDGALFGTFLDCNMSYHVTGQAITKCWQLLKSSSKPGVVYSTTHWEFDPRLVDEEEEVVQSQPAEAPSVKANVLQQEEDVFTIQHQLLALLQLDKQGDDASCSQTMTDSHLRMHWFALQFVNNIEKEEQFLLFAREDPLSNFLLLCSFAWGTTTCILLLVVYLKMLGSPSYCDLSMLFLGVATAFHFVCSVLLCFFEKRQANFSLLFAALNWIGIGMIMIHFFLAPSSVVNHSLSGFQLTFELQTLYNSKVFYWYLVTIVNFLLFHLPSVPSDINSDRSNPHNQLILGITVFVCFSIYRYYTQRRDRQRFIEISAASEATERVTQENKKWKLLLTGMMPPSIADKFMQGRMGGRKQEQRNEDATVEVPPRSQMYSVISFRSVFVDPRYGGAHVTPLEDQIIILLQSHNLMNTVSSSVIESSQYLCKLSEFFSFISQVLEQMKNESDTECGELLKIKAFGDSLMLATQGRNSTSSESLIRAVQFLQLIDAVESQMCVRFELAVVGAVGPVMGAVLGCERISFDVFGSTVLVASEILDATPAGCTVVTEKFAFLYRCALDEKSEKEPRSPAVGVNREMKKMGTRARILTNSVVQIMSFGLKLPPTEDGEYAAANSASASSNSIAKGKEEEPGSKTSRNIAKPEGKDASSSATKSSGDVNFQLLSRESPILSPTPPPAGKPSLNPGSVWALRGFGKVVVHVMKFPQILSSMLPPPVHSDSRDVKNQEEIFS